jgi:hypothetical protein
MNLEDLIWFLEHTPSLRNLTVLVDPRVKSDMLNYFHGFCKVDLIPESPQDSQTDQMASDYQYQPTKYLKRWTLCPDLISLTLSLDWPQTDTNIWMPLIETTISSRCIHDAAMESVACEWSDGNRITRTTKEFRKYLDQRGPSPEPAEVPEK